MLGKTAQGRMDYFVNLILNSYFLILLYCIYKYGIDKLQSFKEHLICYIQQTSNKSSSAVHSILGSCFLFLKCFQKHLKKTPLIFRVMSQVHLLGQDIELRAFISS